MKRAFAVAVALGITAAVAANAEPTPAPPVAGLFYTAPADSVRLADYVGNYTFASNGYFTTAHITVKEGALQGEIDSNGQYKLNKLTDADVFQSTSSYASIYTFLRDATTKQITGLKLTIQGTDVLATKDK